MVEWFDDLKVGMRFKSEAVTVSKDDIIRFAREYDPQPFHLDEEAAKKSIYGGPSELVAPAKPWPRRVPAIHVFLLLGRKVKAWITATSPVMTPEYVPRPRLTRVSP